MAKIQSSIIDPATGKPFIVDREVMTQRVAQATITGVRQAVGIHVSGGLTPQGLASMLRGAEEGDPESYLALAEEMEEKEPHYAAVLGTRKRQVSQLDMTIEPGTTDDIDKKIADAAQEQFLDSELLDDAMFDVLDAVGKGFSLAEIMWDIQGNAWNIRSLEYVDPRFVRFDRETRRIPLLRGDNDGGIGLPLQPFKFLYTEIKAKSGIPIRSGLARLVAWIWMFKNFAVKDWVQFAEIYGMPLRVGEYAPGATEDDKAELLRAVAMISSDAAAIIPQNMKINFQETSKGGTGSVHEPLARFFDEQTSKVTLGQTGTTDATPGKLGGSNDHTQVREDIERADAKAITAVFNRQLIKPWVDFNFGAPASGKYPYLWIGRPEQKDAKLMVDAAAALGGRMRIRAADIRNVVGWSEPQDGDELVGAGAQAQPPGAPGGMPPPGDGTALASLHRRIELLAAELGNRDAIDRATAAQMKNWQPLIPVDQLETAFASAQSFEDLQQRLKHLGGDLKMNPLADRLARLTFAALAAARLGQPIRD